VHWEFLGTVFTTPPAWVVQQLGVTPRDFWALDISYFNGRYHLYYAASQFATNNSVIGLATAKTLDPGSPDYGWTDKGMMMRSTPGADDFNAIDPDVVFDEQGRLWMAFGDFCCRRANSDYRVMVGRSRRVTGPYVDRRGVPLLEADVRGCRAPCRWEFRHTTLGYSRVIERRSGRPLVSRHGELRLGGRRRADEWSLTPSNDDTSTLADRAGSAEYRVKGRTPGSTTIRRQGC
jgi:beta-xylosidase